MSQSSSRAGCVDCGQPLVGSPLRNCVNPDCGMSVPARSYTSFRGQSERVQRTWIAARDALQDQQNEGGGEDGG